MNLTLRQAATYGNATCIVSPLPPDACGNDVRVSMISRSKDPIPIKEPGHATSAQRF